MLCDKFQLAASIDINMKIKIPMQMMITSFHIGSVCVGYVNLSRVIFMVVISDNHDVTIGNKYVIDKI